jgi:hypothetical protein
MRHLLVISFALLMVVALTSSAVLAKVTFSAGPEIGLNFATQAGDDPNWDQDKKGRTGFLFGGVFNIAFAEYIALQPEVRISMKGARWEASQGGQFYELTDKFTYLEIPVFVRGSIPTGTLFTPDLFLGPILGIEMSAKEDLKSNVYQPFSNQTLKTKSIDIGLGFGAGARFTLGPGDAFLNFMYNLGLTNINDNPNYPYNIKNRALNIIGGYAFRFGKR